ncbi:unnamed protein product [Cylindrotheca closterium]|uniref:Uncharacterized protein n=1 Tax=Cylindrotheca closterium TaxID=2856 RepID=A0AAD2FF87_9STRA|nr:unnamed protein product [Cylindrotheca closterium]
MAPIICSCLLSLLYTLYLFIAYEESGVHHAQEYENRFWTIFALLFSTALIFAQDSPMAFGRYSPSLGFFGVLMSSYAMHLWDRYTHRLTLSQQTKLRRSSFALNHHSMGEIKITVDEYLAEINGSLREIDQLLIPSTINNWINQRFVLRKEKEIISVFWKCDAVALNFLIGHTKLGLLMYKIKDHRNFAGQHRSELIELLAVDRLPALTVMSRVIVLHALQILKLRANPRAEHWVRNILLNTHGDDLSEIKTLTDSKGDYFCMNKLIYDDIKSETIRQDILNHFLREGALQLSHMQMGTKRAQSRKHMAWRKILSDVDDTLFCSGGHYPAGIDKRFAKKVVYPGVLAFYRELDLGTSGPEEWPENRVGNLVFLSARPHVYKDVSEKQNFAKFEKLRATGEDGRKGMHTVPSLLPGDIASGSQYMLTSDLEPLARKKFDNFKRYVSIYPEYQHIFVCDNGQGDVKASEMMFDNFPYEFGGVYIHKVQRIQNTHGFAPERWRKKEFSPCFFTTYPEAALHAATRDPPLIRVSGLRRVCHEAANDFNSITEKQWPSKIQKSERRAELNQAIWKANLFLEKNGVDAVKMVQAEQLFQDGERVNTPYGRGVIQGFDPETDLYDVELDWRPLDVQVDDHLKRVKEEAIRPRQANNRKQSGDRKEASQLQTVLETDEADDDENDGGLASEITERLALDTEIKKENTKSTLSLPGTAETSEARSSDGGTTDVSSLSSISTDDGSKRNRPFCQARAKIRGRQISKFTPPRLPVVDKKSTAYFSFFAGSPYKKGQLPPVLFQEGDKCSTPYGPATILEYRATENIVVVEFSKWKARGYLNEIDVKVTKERILLSLSLFRRQGSTSETTLKPLEFPYATGTLINTPYGAAELYKPLLLTSKQLNETELLNQIIGLRLVSWKLANGSYPTMHCTVKTVQQWKNSKSRSSTDGLLSTFGTLLTMPFSSRFGTPAKKITTAVEAEKIPKFRQYYNDSTKVSTAYGNGEVLEFREEDGFYKVSITSWTLANGQCATAWLREVDIRCRIADGCQEGYPVLTGMGLTGILESVQPSTGVHLVTVPSAGMAMYLQPDAIDKRIKGAVGEDAFTAYGEGTIENYDAESDMYVIRLKGWGAKLYCKAEKFDRVRDSSRDRNALSSVGWLFDYFFSSRAENPGEVGTRTRSNSLTSASASVRSVT